MRLGEAGVVASLGSQRLIELDRAIQIRERVLIRTGAIRSDTREELRAGSVGLGSQDLIELAARFVGVPGFEQRGTQTETEVHVVGVESQRASIQFNGLGGLTPIGCDQTEVMNRRGVLRVFGEHGLERRLGFFEVAIPVGHDAAVKSDLGLHRSRRFVCHDGKCKCECDAPPIHPARLSPQTRDLQVPLLVRSSKERPFTKPSPT